MVNLLDFLASVTKVSPSLNVGYGGLKEVCCLFFQKLPTQKPKSLMSASDASECARCYSATGIGEVYFKAFCNCKRGCP